MNFTFYLKLYLLTVPVFFLIDILWLGLIARGFYRTQLSDFLSDSVNWTAAMVFYFLYIVGIIFFAVAPALDATSWQKAVLYGALFGLFTYATYDLTNLATLNNWPIKVVIVDILWGIVLCTSVAFCSYQIGKWLGTA